MRQLVGHQQLLHVFLAHDAQLFSHHGNLLAVGNRSLGDLGGFFVANQRVQRRHQRHGLGNARIQQALVSHNAFHAVHLQSLAGAAQVGKAFVQGPCHQRLKSVELQLTCFHCHGDGSIVANHFKADLVHHFGDHGVDLARHDGRTRLTRWQLDVAHTSLWAGRQQTQVIADLGQFDGNTLQNAGNIGKRAGIASRRNQVSSFDHGYARNISQCLDHCIGIAHGGVDAGANGGAAHVHFGHQVGRFTQTLFIVGDHGGKSGEFLAQCHRHGVL